MHPFTVLQIISVLTIVISACMILPLTVALYYWETDSLFGFGVSMVCFAVFGLLSYFFSKKRSKNILSIRDGFILVSLSWLGASLVGAFPYYISGQIPSFTDAFFETASGFTTTGASILTNIEGLSFSMLFWRSFTQWLGGMGIIVLTVAILPILGIGGLQLVKAEAPGPVVDKISPRIAETAKKLWLIYVGLTLMEVFFLKMGGVSLYDAFAHSFSTLATGGFSTKNSSIAGFNSPYVEWVITVFMILAGINFSIHFRLLTGRLKNIFRDSELKAYLFITVISTAIASFYLYINTYSSISDSLRYGAFQVVSILTTTGFATADYEIWGTVPQTVIFMLMFIGGCSGSTGGGIKVIRVISLLKQAFNEMKYLLHPKGVFILKISGNAVKKDIIYAISGFFFLYITTSLVVTLIVATSGVDILTSFTTALTALGNIGPGFGLVGPTENFAFFKDYVKWVLSITMIAGRLEIYTFLIIFLPYFWKN